MDQQRYSNMMMGRNMVGQDSNDRLMMGQDNIGQSMMGQDNMGRNMMGRNVYNVMSNRGMTSDMSRMMGQQMDSKMMGMMGRDMAMNMLGNNMMGQDRMANTNQISSIMINSNDGLMG